MDIKLQRQLFKRYPLFFRKPGYRLSFDRPLIANIASAADCDEFVVHIPATTEGGAPYRVSDRSPIDSQGIQCEDGWFRIVDGVAAAFELEIREMFSNGVSSNEWPRAAAIREKLGTLRIAVTGRVEPRLREIIEDAETESANTCIDCGAEGYLHNRDRLMFCLCQACAETRDQTVFTFDFQRFLANACALEDLLRQREALDVEI